MENRARLVALMVLFSAVIVGLQATSQGEALAMWNMPYAEAFPGGLSLGPGGTVYFAMNGGMEVYRLDPANDVFRSWGVGERPEDVTVVDGVPFCTIGSNDLVVYFNPDGLSATSARIPFPDVHPGEIHRGADTGSGDRVFWIAERNVPGILRFEYRPAIDAPAIYGDPSEQSAGRRTVAIEPRSVTADYEAFAYDVACIPAATPIVPLGASYPFTEWRIPIGADFYVQDIACADDGKLWISFGAPSLFRFDPIAGTLQEMETIQNVAIFQGLLPAADGSIWFGNIVEGSIGHFDPALGVSEVWRIPGTGEVYDLTFARDGAIWYTDRIGDAIGRFDPWTGEVRVYSLPEGSEPLYLAIDADDAVWFTAGSGNYIGRLTTLGQAAPQTP